VLDLNSPILTGMVGKSLGSEDLVLHQLQLQQKEKEKEHQQQKVEIQRELELERATAIATQHGTPEIENEIEA